MIIRYQGFLGSNDADHIIGTDGMDKIDGLKGNDVIRGRGGDDAISGDEGADRFVYSAPSSAPLAAYGNRTEGVDMIHGFVSSEGDRIDLSELAAPLTTGLSFTEQTLAAHSVSYAEGFDKNLLAFGEYIDEDCYDCAVTLTADLDGNVENGGELSIVLLDVARITASDLILS